MRSRTRDGTICPLLEFCLWQAHLETGPSAGFFVPGEKQKPRTCRGFVICAGEKREGDSRGCSNTQRRRQIADHACKPAKALTARASGGSLAEKLKALQMLRDIRCGNCKRLLARASGVAQLQIKCSRCGTLNHVRAESPELSPLSDMKEEASSNINRLNR